MRGLRGRRMETDVHYRLEWWFALDAKLQGLQRGRRCQHLPSKSSVWLLPTWTEERRQRIPHVVHAGSGAGNQRGDRWRVLEATARHTRQHRVRLVPWAAPVYVESLA